MMVVGQLNPRLLQPDCKFTKPVCVGRKFAPLQDRALAQRFVPGRAPSHQSTFSVNKYLTATILEQLDMIGGPFPFIFYRTLGEKTGMPAAHQPEPIVGKDRREFLSVPGKFSSQFNSLVSYFRGIFQTTFEWDIAS